LEFRKIQNITGDSLCGYYPILSQLYVVYSGDTLGPFNNNEEIKFKARNNALSIKENVVKPYLQNLSINWNASNNRETWNNYMNG
jgi:hypothetical protein